MYQERYNLSQKKGKKCGKIQATNLFTLEVAPKCYFESQAQVNHQFEIMQYEGAWHANLTNSQTKKQQNHTSARQ